MGGLAPPAPRIFGLSDFLMAFSRVSLRSDVSLLGAQRTDVMNVETFMSMLKVEPSTLTSPFFVVALRKTEVKKPCKASALLLSYKPDHSSKVWIW